VLWAASLHWIESIECDGEALEVLLSSFSARTQA